MQQLINCPICNDIMLTLEMDGDCTLKSCKKYPTHRIQLVSIDFNNEIYKMSLLVNDTPATWMTWHFLSKEVRVHNYSKALSKMIGDPFPWFEPDISNYHKLMEKIKTYLVFS